MGALLAYQRQQPYKGSQRRQCVFLVPDEEFLFLLAIIYKILYSSA